jgi:hypothetical protein
VTTSPRPLLPRLHLVEIHEEPWCPDVLRRACTDYLRTVVERMGTFAPLAPKLADLLRDTGARRLVDLCSGGSGPLVPLVRALAADHGLDVTVTLTDLHPNLGAFARARGASKGAVDFFAEPVDARRVPADLAGVRTMFDAFHHFRPDDARAILADAAGKRAPILIAEVARRAPADLIGMILLIPLITLFVMPLVRPLGALRLALTYLIPLLPLVIAFDGFVSCMRAYAVPELTALAEGLGGAGYRFEVGAIRGRGGVITYVIGRPLPTGSAPAA